MTPRTARRLLFGSPLAALLLTGLIKGGAENDAWRIREQHQAELTLVKTAPRNQQLAVRSDLQAQREQVLLAALGTPLETAVRNPNLDILRMLEGVAKACAPPTAYVRVTVDRFTEFTVNIRLLDSADPAVIAPIAIGVLAHGAPYINNLCFVFGGEIVSELDRRVIDSVQNWAAASPETVERLLLSLRQTANSPPPQPPSGSAAGPALTEEGRRLRGVETNFYNLIAQRTDWLNAAQKFIGEARRLATIQQRGDLFGRIESLAQARAHLAVFRDGYRQQTEVYRTSLQAQNLDPQLLAVWVKIYARRHAPEVPLMENCLNAADALARATAAYLETMNRNWGSWRGDAARGLISFDSVTAGEACRRAAQIVEAADADLSAAIAALNAHNSMRVIRTVKDFQIPVKLYE